MRTLPTTTPASTSSPVRATPRQDEGEEGGGEGPHEAEEGGGEGEVLEDGVLGEGGGKPPKRLAKRVTAKAAPEAEPMR